MTIDKITKIFLKISASILVIGGMLSLLKGCSPEWNGHEGGAAIGAASQSLNFIGHGILLWIVTGLFMAMYKLSTTKNKAISISSAFISAIAGLFILYSGVLNSNPFTRSNSQLLYLIPGKFLGFLSGAIFILIGINAFASTILVPRSEDR